jgi:Ni/Fe-hydrogenase subunit HybB-like protein
LVQALIAGAAVFLLITLFSQARFSNDVLALGSRINLFIITRTFLLLLFFMVVSLCMTLAELFLPHASEDARLATRNLVRGPLSTRFWGLAIGAGLVLPMVLLSCVLLVRASLKMDTALLATAAVLALAGVWFFEDVWVKAGQSVPLS